MKNIGRVIHTARKNAGLTQKELAEGICTIKHIYLIEKGFRQPSAEMLESLGNRMGTGFFQYMPYMSCDDPIEVKAFVDRFSRLRCSGDFSQLEKENERARHMADFQRYPWIMELQHNEVVLRMYQLKDFEGAKAEVTAFLRLNGAQVPITSPLKKTLPPEIIMLYNLLAVCELHLGHPEKALEIFEPLYQFLRKKVGFQNFDTISISVRINHSYCLGMQGRYEEQLSSSDELIALQTKSNRLDRAYLSFFTKAAALASLGRKEEARTLFRKSFFAGLAFDEYVNLKDLSQEPILKEFVEQGVFSMDLLELIEAR